MANNPLSAAADAILHVKVSDEEERLMFPATRYDNIINRPVVVTDPTKLYGAPFGFYKTDVEYISRSQLKSLIGPIM